MFQKIILSIEIITAILGCVYFYKYKRTPLWPWLILLLLAPLAEIIGVWYSNNITYNNHVIFNIYDIIGQVILLKIIYDFVEDHTRKKAVFAIGVLSLAFFVINCTYESVVTGFLTLYKSFETAFMILALAIYLIDILKNDSIIAFRNNLPFIVFTGYLIFNVVYLPIYFAFQYLVNLSEGGEIMYPVLKNVLGYTIAFINVLFIFGILWTRKVETQKA